MVRTSKIKVKSIENEEIIVAMAMTKTTTTKLIITLRMGVRMKIGNRIVCKYKDAKTE